ncbi:MAG: hypothetical protein IKT17_04350 [Lachnospiraceae bacterium]|nr:hypothetical protein [Lachnospiraceae bacterium]
MFSERYESGINGRCLILEGDDKADKGYITRMITENRIPGYLACSVVYADGCIGYVYDVTGKKSLGEMYEHEEIGYAALCDILNSLATALESAEEYLLPTEHLMMDPHHIYTGQGDKRMSFCYYPGTYSTLSESMIEIAEFILQKADHTDDPATMLAYDFYKQVSNGDYTVRMLLNRTEAMIGDDIAKEECLENMVIEDDELYPPATEDAPVIPAAGKMIMAVCIGILMIISGFVLTSELNAGGTAAWLMAFKEMKLLVCTSSAMSVLLPIFIFLKWFNESKMYRERVDAYDNDRSSELFYFG